MARKAKSWSLKRLLFACCVVKIFSDTQEAWAHIEAAEEGKTFKPYFPELA